MRRQNVQLELLTHIVEYMIPDSKSKARTFSVLVFVATPSDNGFTNLKCSLLSLTYRLKFTSE